jgi:hypothetical protein
VAAGSDTQVMFNDGGSAFGGDAGLTYNKTTDSLTVVGGVATGSGVINAQTGTSYTLQASDNGKVVTLSNASAITLTVPTGLATGFACLLVQLGVGQVTVTPSSTTVNPTTTRKLVAQYSVATLIGYAANTFILGGDITA